MASSGPRYPTTDHTFNNPGEIGLDDYTKLYAADAQYATFTRNSPGSNDNCGMGGFGFSIPAGATINGIVAEVRGMATGSDITFDYVALYKTTTFAGSKTSGVTMGALTTYTLGSSVDLWGTTWTPAQINAIQATFGFTKQGNNFNTETGSFDYIRLTVYYTASATEAAGGILYTV